MASLYGNKWTSTMGETDHGNMWLAALNGLVFDQLKIGMSKCADSGEAWPPSAPEFKAMCLPDPTDYGLPDAESAYREACDNCHQPSRHKWSDNAVYAAGCMVQWFNLRTQSGKEDVKNTKRSYLRAYESACKDVMEGKTINGPQVVERGLEQP